jgi:glutamyl-tRNA synthetase
VEKVLKKNNGLGLLKEVRGVLAELQDWSVPLLDQALKSFCEQKQQPLGNVAQPIRVALAGTAASPPIHETLFLLGKDETVRRIDAAVAKAS